jgi:hypothetical protein
VGTGRATKNQNIQTVFSGTATSLEMSGSRRFQREAVRARRTASKTHSDSALRSMLETALASPAVLVANNIGGLEMWTKGEVLFGLIPLVDSMPYSVKQMVALRRSAMLNGKCDCGEGLVIRNGTLTVEHAKSCPAIDPLSETAYRRWLTASKGR